MAYEFLIISIFLTIMFTLTTTCENFEAISVKENIQYPSAYLLDVTESLYKAHITSDNDKDNFYLTDVTGSKPFILANGKLSVSGQLDREEICNNENTDQKENINHCCTSLCCMYIGVTTSQGKTVYIKVNIEDENDNEPVFPQQSIKSQIHENVEIGFNIAIPKAKDLDSSSFGIDRYELKQDKNCGECFLVKSDSRDSGPILVTKTKIDREQNSVFHLQVLAIDKGIPAKTGILSVRIDVIDINDNSPKFEETSILISEQENGSPGREIRIIKVSDNDIGINSQISYLIEDFNSLAQKYFRLFPLKNGVRFLLQTILDYEVISFFQFKIIAKDHGTPSLSSTLTVNVRVINVNDEPPEIVFYQRGVALNPNNNILSFPENGPMQQNLILIHVSDKDSKLSDISCEISYPQGVFYLHENQQNNILEKKKIFDLQNSITFDREVTSLYIIIIMCSDSNNMLKQTSSTEIQLRITDINDNPPTFSSSFYFGKILETNTLDKDVDMKNGVIKVTDADIDKNSRITFSLTDIGNSTDSHKFSVTPHYAQIKNSAPIDYEEKKQYIFLLVAKDDGFPVLSTSATITINVLDANDNIPEISQKFYSFSLLEEQPIGTEIGIIEATDADTDPGNKDFIFEIVNHDGSRSNSRPNKLFLIENNTGRIKTKVTLDHEEDQHINFLVRVRNSNDDINSKDRLEAYGGSVSVNVKITDINDNYPKLILKDNQNQETSNNLDPIKRPVILINNDLQSTANQCSHFPYTFTDADEGINSEVRVSLKKNPYFQLEMGHNLICPINSNLAPGPYTVFVIGEDRNGLNGSKRSEQPINIIVKSSNINKQVSPKKSPRHDHNDKSPDYKAVIIFIVLIATIILFCILLMIVVVKTKICIPRNISLPLRNREKVDVKQNNTGINKNYNIIIPEGSCENKRLCNDYVRSNLNNQNMINSDYSNNVFYPRTVSPSMVMLDGQSANEGTLTNVFHSSEYIFNGNDGTVLAESTLNKELRYEQLQRTPGQSLLGNTSSWDKGSLPTNYEKSTPNKQDILAVATRYQKSINDVYLQTSFV